MNSYNEFNYQAYLESKIKIDYRSLNRTVFNTFKTLIRREKNPVILDIGTGTGLMIRKLLQLKLVGDVMFYGLEWEKRSCEKACELIKEELSNFGFTHYKKNNVHFAQKDHSTYRIEIIHSDFFDDKTFESLKTIGFKCITANSFMDMVYLDSAVDQVHRLLRKNGIFYSTINYDGLTNLLPLWLDESFEGDLLSAYNFSMDTRRVNGKSTGGSRTGSRLFSAAQKRGFSIIDYGSSDWQLFPKKGRYSKDERFFLKTIIRMIYKEGTLVSSIDKRKLEEWYNTRLMQINDNLLTLITHQTDILAIKKTYQI